MRFAIMVSALALVPTGCIAAAPVAMYAVSAAGLAYSGYNLYSAGNVENAEYKVKRADVSSQSLTAVRAASSLAVYPTATEVDGIVVDTFRQQSDMEIISSRTTIDIIERTRIDQTKLMAYPAEDRALELRNFASAAGADLVVFAVISGGRASTNVLMPGMAKSIVDVNCKIVSGDTGQVLFEEEHEIKIDIGDAPSSTDIAQLAAFGISDRLNELRNPGAQTAYFSKTPPLAP